MVPVIVAPEAPILVGICRGGKGRYDCEMYDDHEYYRSRDDFESCSWCASSVMRSLDRLEGFGLGISPYASREEYEWVEGLE